MSKADDLLQIFVGGLQVQLGFAITLIDGPAPFMDLIGAGIMWHGRGNLMEGWHGLTSSEQSAALAIAENEYWISQGVRYYP